LSFIIAFASYNSSLLCDTISAISSCQILLTRHIFIARKTFYLALLEIIIITAFVLLVECFVWICQVQWKSVEPFCLVLRGKESLCVKRPQKARLQLHTSFDTKHVTLYASILLLIAQEYISISRKLAISVRDRIVRADERSWPRTIVSQQFSACAVAFLDIDLNLSTIYYASTEYIHKYIYIYIYIYI